MKNAAENQDSLFQSGEKSHLKYVPLDNWPPRIFEGLFPMLEARLVLLVLAPAKLYLSDGISAANQVIITNLEAHCITIDTRETWYRLIRGYGILVRKVRASLRGKKMDWYMHTGIKHPYKDFLSDLQDLSNSIIYIKWVLIL